MVVAYYGHLLMVKARIHNILNKATLTRVAMMPCLKVFPQVLLFGMQILLATIVIAVLDDCYKLCR